MKAGIVSGVARAASMAVLSLCAIAGRAQYAGPPVTATSPAGGVPESALRAAYDDLRILPGDVIGIATLGAPELTTTAMVPAGGLVGSSAGGPALGILVNVRGDIVLPYLGAVHVAGLTPAEVAELLTRRLKEQGILVDPQVTVDLVTSPTRAISVLGEVARPATVSSFPGLRLLDAVASCGGFTPQASHTLTIRRVGAEEPLTIELSIDPHAASTANIALLPGDTVLVPKVGSVYVLGEVKAPQPYSLAGNAPVTVLRALSMAGGLKYSASLSHTRILRTTADNRKVEIVLDLKKIMNGKQQDVALMNDDVLFVPANVIRNAISNGAVSIAAQLVYQSIIAETQLMK